MRTRTKGLLALLVLGFGAGVSAAVLRRRLYSQFDKLAIAPLGADGLARDPAAAVQLNQLLGGLLSGFPGIDLSGLDDEEPRTIGDILQEAEFIGLLRISEWPFTNDTALDVDDDHFTVDIEVPGGVVTLVETEKGFTVNKYVTASGLTYKPAGALQDGLMDSVDYHTFLTLVEEHKIGEPTGTATPVVTDPA